jgi:hypothetical protein
MGELSPGLEHALPNRLFYDRRMIRQAVASDAVKAAPLIVQAIGHIAFVLTGTTDSHESSLHFKGPFWTRGHSHQLSNALTMEEKGSWSE